MVVAVNASVDSGARADVFCDLNPWSEANLLI
jgi:hypothetical protein